ncbi:MAG: PorP/SprF family type IX secretion system membrane protein [Cyclobacteriaceae bacterium]|nr:PorP/SprF family type IX secretion system membrane protein [Cyclobacteriaceae bacterium]UYN85812.1 MAG: PorP/SprF family type IX secretion system membrane protein [Cyclobacteriaceae bacterium]
MNFLRPLLALILLQVLLSPVVAQQNLIYNHYFLSPYLLNPSFIAPNGYTELNLNFRKQWAQFDGSPSTITANLQVPVNYKMGWAVNVYNDQAGVLQTNAGSASFAYQAYLGKSTDTNHKIGFGLSMGYSMSRVDISKVDDPTDPSLTNSNTSNLIGQFGIHYQFNNLKIGFALPSLFATKVISEDNFNTPEFDALKNTFSSISYNFKISDRFAFEPYFLYRTNEIKESQFEVLGVLKIDNLLWAGGSYRQDYGPAAFLGFFIKEKINVGYAYEFAPNVVDGFGTGSHELHVRLRLGKKQVSRPSPTTKTTQPAEEPAKQEKATENTEPEEKPVDRPVTEEQPKQEAKVEQPTATPEVKPEEPKAVEKVVEEKSDLPPGYYVIVGAFKYSTNANKYANDLKANGFPAIVTYSALRNFSYVHVGNFQTLEEARTVRDQYRAKSRFYFRDTWILLVK